MFERVNDVLRGVFCCELCMEFLYSSAVFGMFGMFRGGCGVRIKV